MLTKEQGLANLGPDDVARRQEAERLYLAARNAPDHPQEILEQIAKLDEELDNKITALEAEYEAKKKALTNGQLSEREQAEQAWQSYEPFGDVAEDWKSEDNALRCSLTGLLIEEYDETVSVGDKTYLVAALGLPDIDVKPVLPEGFGGELPLVG